jgi:hypothetical protein
VDWGHHNLGDYHFFVRFKEGARSLGERADETYLSHESFLSLVSAVHEAYHVFQSLVTGAGCSVVHAEDYFVGAFRQAVASGADADMRFAGLLSTGADYLRRHFYTAEDSEYLFHSAQKRSPSVADTLGALSKVTTASLLECQAALLTELYISHLLTWRPQTFDMQKVADLVEAFRLEQMEGLYRIPLDRFRETVGRIIPRSEFDQASRSHPLYPQCPNIAEYGLLGFLLDYALHLPPPIVEELGPVKHDVYREDFDPPVRYAKLLEALLADIVMTHRGVRSPELPELNLSQPYESLSPRLAKWIDIGDLLARAEAEGFPATSLPPPNLLFPLKREEIVEALKLKAAPVTFPTFDKVSELWLSVHRSSEPPQDLYRLTATRTAAMKTRLQTADVFSAWRPIGFFAEMGIPSFLDTPSGLAPGDMGAMEMRIKKEKYDPNDSIWQRFSITVIDREDDGEFVTLKCYPGTPYEFLDKVIWREILFRSCQSVLTGTPMACPLAVGLFAQVPCEGRGPQCARIEVPAQLPPRPGCMARALYETYVDGGKNRMQILTDELVDRCFNECRKEVANVLGAEEQRKDDRSLHMDPTAILAIVAWKVLVPFVVSLSASVSAAAINAKLIKGQSVKGLKEMIQERVGQPIRIDPTRVEECVILVEEILQPFGVDREKARRIVDVLVSTATASGNAPGTSESRSPS